MFFVASEDDIYPSLKTQPKIIIVKPRMIELNKDSEGSRTEVLGKKFDRVSKLCMYLEEASRLRKPYTHKRYIKVV